MAIALNKQKHSIKLKLCIYFLIFTITILILLWLFQIIFLDAFYKAIKTQNIKSYANIISANIESVDLETIIENIAIQNDVCIRIVDKNFIELYDAQRFPNCVIHKMNTQQLQEIYKRALENDNIFVKSLNLDEIKNVQQGIFPNFEQDFSYDYKNNSNSSFEDYYKSFWGNYTSYKNRNFSEDLILAQITKTSKGEERLILLNSNITPINSTVETLRVQLILITIILSVFSIVLAVLLSRRISKPIIMTNNTAKELAKGNYDIDFQNSGYREISELNQTLNFATSELSQVDKLRRELIANISHDLRTPLTMIGGYSEMMRDIPGENTPENLQVIIDETLRLTNLVSDILDLSKIQSGTQTLNLQNFNLTQNIRNILKRYSKLTEQDGYSINFISTADAYVNADEIKISQVIYNLINNAINYTGDDKSVTVKQVLKHGIVRIEITDSGPGIPPEMIPYIWDRYYKVDKTHKRSVVGTGIGLSIVKSIMDLHKTDYGVISNPEKGSTFWFELNMVAF